MCESGALIYSLENPNFTSLDYTSISLMQKMLKYVRMNTKLTKTYSQSIELQSSKGSLWEISLEDTIGTGNQSENDDFYNDEESESSVY